MSTRQATIPFNIRKKSSNTTSFYGIKEKVVTEDFSNAALRQIPELKYIPTVKKIVTLTSSDSDSDGDAENAAIRKPSVKNSRKRNTTDKVSTPRKNKDENGATPPKQKKIEESFSSTTPSNLLSILDIECVAEDVEKSKDKRVPKSSKFQSARQALHSSVSVNLPGREKELTELREFISDCLKNFSSGSLYVSGPPGTGKTASLSKIMLEPEFKAVFKVIYINCTAIKSAGAIYAKIVQDLGLNLAKSEKANKSTVEKYLKSKHQMLLLVLDEIDQLTTRSQSVLYTIFEWPSKEGSKLVLVGIANALDLTDRILPRLQARCELRPKLMHFAPYSKKQIVDIITERLEEANVSDVLNGVAVQMLAAKVAAISGDIRKALDISRRVIEIAEAQRVAQVLQPCNDNGSNTVGSPRKQQEIPQEKSVGLKEVVTVLNSVYGGAQNVNNEESIFPLQQKLLLCSLMLILNKGKNKDVTIGMLHEVYKKVCKKRNIHMVDMSEFVSLCSLVETRGVLRIVGKKEPRLSKVHLQWDQDELGGALQDKTMMSEILNDASCL
ncbi:cell division control protein 6 homolog isoform X2 [Diprion similis]|uniref:cell division control protein 6 homolog isoform X2 n=1 Tax=Diprion similis TaxID=362088 RepID=UPI001EF89AC2|nr:cell division control protein 6 homolog isoform X2 [Diprion similis]